MTIKRKIRTTNMVPTGVVCTVVLCILSEIFIELKSQQILNENKMLTLMLGPSIHIVLKVLQILLMLSYVMVCQIILISQYSDFRCKIGFGYVEISTPQSSKDKSPPPLQIQDISSEPS
jgi:hypothetical protein